MLTRFIAAVVRFFQTATGQTARAERAHYAAADVACAEIADYCAAHDAAAAHTRQIGRDALTAFQTARTARTARTA